MIPIPLGLVLSAQRRRLAAETAPLALMSNAHRSPLLYSYPIPIFRVRNKKVARYCCNEQKKQAAIGAGHEIMRQSLLPDVTPSWAVGAQDYWHIGNAGDAIEECVGGVDRLGSVLRLRLLQQIGQRGLVS